MTDHLPECYLFGPPSLCPMCESLRACEQRVLDAARDAVLSVKHDNRLCPDSCCQQLRYALAAIDALRGES